MIPDFYALAKASIRQITPYQPGKSIEELERELGITSSIKLASNENPLGASNKAKDAAILAIENAHIYPAGDCFELKAALENLYHVSAAQLTIGNGSENILELIVKAYLQPEHSAIISQYAFLTIPILINSYGVNLKVAPAENWGHSVKNILNAIDDTTRVIFLVNPNNPTGTYTNQFDFDLLINAIPKHILLVADEAYAEYINQSDYPRTLEYLKKYSNLIVVRTFSKAYGLAALRVGYSISSVEIADILNRARLPFNVNSIAIKAATAALSDQSHLTQTIALNQQSLKHLEHHIEKMGLNYIPSIANFLTIDVGNATHIYQQLLRQGVIVRPLTSYQMPAHIRVTTGTIAQNERFLSALHTTLNMEK